MSNDKNMLQEYEDEYVEIPKSNGIIKSIGRQSIIANKVLLVALSKVEDRKGVANIINTRYQDYLDEGLDLTKGLIAEMRSADIAEFNNGSGSFYKRIEELFDNDSNGENTLRGMFNIMVQNDITGVYASVSLIQLTLYDKKKKKLFIKFTDEPIVRKNVWELKTNYTKLPRKTMLSLKYNSTFKLFEILKSDFDRENAIRRKKNLPPVTNLQLRYSVSELKFKMGILSTDRSEVTAALKERNPMYDEIEEILNEQKEGSMSTYTDFKRYALLKAKNEINKKTNMEIKFIPVKVGKGGKVVAIDFFIQVKDHEGVELNEEQKLEFVQEIMDIIDEKIKIKDAKILAEDAEYDMEKIKKAYEAKKASKTKIDNLIGFMRSAINEDYEENESIEPKSYNTEFHKFEKREYDFEKLEEQLLAK